MKKVIFFISMFFVVTLSAHSQDITATSKIDKVLLFSNQALVTKSGAATVSEGLNRILIEINAFWVDPDSLQASLYGKGELQGVQLKKIHLKDMPQENIKKLTDKLEELEDQKESLANQKKAIKKKEDFLTSLIKFSQSQVPQEIKTNFPKVDDIEKTANFIETSFKATHKEKEKLNKAIKDLDQEISIVIRELGSLKRPSQKAKNVAEILFNSKKQQKIDLELTYLTNNAWWQPIYKINTSLDLKSIDLTMFASLEQMTGEDWIDVNLSLSNVMPLKGINLPYLKSWGINIYPSRAKRKYLSLGKSQMLEQEANYYAATADSLAEEGIPQSVPVEKAEYKTAAKKELPLSFEYGFSQQFSIESKNKETILPVFTKKIKGNFVHYSVPKVNPLVFLVCQAQADKEILSGRLNVYFGGRFIGKTFLSEKKPGEEFDINLGADRQVKVTREKTKDKIKETFFQKISRQTIIREMSFKITAENLKNKPVKLRILDNIPVSKTDKIKVEDVSIRPEPIKTNYQDKEGVNLWELTLDPEKKKEITINFTITYPKDSKISGL